MQSSYGPDLAAIHHAGFSDFVRGAAPGVLAALRKAGVGSGSVIDLGCGTGAWALELSRRGYAVLGVDASAAMIRIARRVAPKATFRRSSLDAVRLPPCDAVTALGEVLSYVPRHTRRPTVRRWFQRIARAVRPGGMLIFDVLVTGGTPMRYRSWHSGEDWLVVIDVSEDRERHVLVRRITTFVRRGRSYRRSDERHVLCVYRPAALVADLRATGFSVTTARRYGDFTLAERRLAVFARRQRSTS